MQSPYGPLQTTSSVDGAEDVYRTLRQRAGRSQGDNVAGTTPGLARMALTLPQGLPAYGLPQYQMLLADIAPAADQVDTDLIEILGQAPTLPFEILLPDPTSPQPAPLLGLRTGPANPPAEAIPYTLVLAFELARSDGRRAAQLYAAVSERLNAVLDGRNPAGLLLHAAYDYSTTTVERLLVAEAWQSAAQQQEFLRSRLQAILEQLSLPTPSITVGWPVDLAIGQPNLTFPEFSRT